jgi:hypothetical protein
METYEEDYDGSYEGEEDCPCVTGGAPETSGSNIVYTGAATFGRVYATIGAVIGIIIAIILIFLGLSRFRDPHTQTVAATVVGTPRCQTVKDNSITYDKCVVSARYQVAGVSYIAHNLVLDRASPVAAGDVITLRYIPGDPQNAIYEFAPRETGLALIGIGLLLGGITGGIAYMTYKSKPFAAGYGAVEGISTIGRAF